MTTKHQTDRNPCVSCTIAPAIVVMIDGYASSRDEYRADWLRDAIAEKLEREFKAEKAQNRKVF